MTRIAPTLSDYADRYANAELSRSDEGVLEVRLHTDGGSLVWDARAHDELAYLFENIACDRDNEVVILTGTGDSFCTDIDMESFALGTASDWANLIFEGQRLMNNLLRIEVPVIGAVNGPTTIHPDLPMLSDVVIMADDAYFTDAAHYPNGLVPGDGAQVVWMHLLGQRRGAWFLMGGEELHASQALEWGVVNQVLPKEQLMDRARELAAVLVAKPRVARRFTRSILTREWKTLMNDQLTLGLTSEALGVYDLMGK
jgi:enoyl-CoA hydratase/carnithine racemase